MTRVVLAMSGGVDSSVAAHLLRAQGYDVVGVFMRHGEPPAGGCEGAADAGGLPVVNPAGAARQGCCSAVDALDAARVADRLRIPFYAVDLRDEFGRIIEYFVDEYASGRTPNPCVVCNHWLKFGRLFDFADSIGGRYVATGHYARLLPAEGADGQPQLCRGVDADKDQSYVLFGIERSRLARMLLPVGGYRKPEIRRLASQLGLAVADKRDSQEICFVAPGRHASFVAARKGARATAGELVTTDGRVVGAHAGIERFTVGQRKGLGVALGEAYFVVRIEPGTRRVILGRRDELACGQLTASRVNWLIPPPTQPLRCHVQIRYGRLAHAAEVFPLEGGRMRVVLDQPCYGVAPGQAAVCYLGTRVLGGGWIERLRD